MPDGLNRRVLFVCIGNVCRSPMASALLSQRLAGYGRPPVVQSAGIEAMVLSPQCGDFNEDLRNFDINALRAALRFQLTPEDVGRFLSTGV